MIGDIVEMNKGRRILKNNNTEEKRWYNLVKNDVSKKIKIMKKKILFTKCKKIHD